jgi:hypothetical protein
VPEAMQILTAYPHVRGGRIGRIIQIRMTLSAFVMMETETVAETLNTNSAGCPKIL